MDGLNPRESENRERFRKSRPRVFEKMARFTDKVKRGDSIAIIQLQYDYRCNMRCEHCSVKGFQGENSRRALTPADVAGLADQADALGLARFVITGGEPTVFKDLHDIVRAIDPRRFYINCDSNGWLLDEEKIIYLKGIGIDRIQLSLDSLDPAAHDAFRRMPGAHARVMKAVDYCLKHGLGVYIQTVVTRERLFSREFIDFIEFFNNKGVGVFVSYAKPVGAWEGRFENLVRKTDFEYMRGLEKKYRVFTHLTPGYGLHMGCIAVKGMISVTQYGDVLPCPYIHVSIGNIFEEPLKKIIERGLGIRFFGEYRDTCLIAEDRDFIFNYVAEKIYGRRLPVPCGEMFGPADRTKIPFYKEMPDK